MLSKLLKIASKDVWWYLKRGVLWCSHAVFACGHTDLLVTTASK